jgi:hypothetical protein
MRVTQKSFSGFCWLVVALGASTPAAVAQGQWACAQIRAACQNAGFVQGAASSGVGLQVDCIIPVMLGIPQRPRAHRPLPRISPLLVAECAASHPLFGRPYTPNAQPIAVSSGAGRHQPEPSRPSDNSRQASGSAAASHRPRIGLPEPELLERQAAPDCEFKSDAQADNEAAARAMKLDYEEQCYRQSEFILRARMERLQDAVRKTIESLKPDDRSSAK